MWRYHTLLVCVFVAMASDAFPAESIWTTNSSSNWSVASNWFGNNIPPANGNLDQIITYTNFAVTASTVTSTNDLVTLPATTYQLNTLNLAPRYGTNTSIGLTQAGFNVAGSPLEFVTNSLGFLPQITLTGASSSIAANLVLTNDTTINGTSQGMLLLTGTLSGPGKLIINRSGYGETNLTGTNNTHAGTTLINGVLAIRTTGGLGLGTFTVNGGIVRTLPTSNSSPPPITIPNNIQLNASLLLQGNNTDTVSTTFSGSINGVGGIQIDYSPNTYILTAVNGFTGGINLISAANIAATPLFRLVDSGTVLNASSVTIGANTTFRIDESGTSNLTNRIDPALNVKLHGTLLIVGTGTPALSTVENLNGIVFEGYPNVEVNITSSRPTQLILTGPDPIVRSNRAVIFFNGSTFGTLGAGAGAAGNVVLTNPTNLNASLVGGGGSAASSTAKNVSIIPFIVTAPSQSSDPSMFATYTAAKGIQPLLSTQYQTSFTVAGTQDNVRITTTANGTVAAGGITVNSLAIFNNSSSTTVNVTGGPATIASGAVLIDTANDTTIDSLVFPLGVEGIITSTITVSGKTVTVGSIVGVADVNTGLATGLTKAGNALLNVSLIDVPGPLTINSSLIAIGSDSVLNNITGVLLNGGGLRWTGPTSSTRSYVIGPVGGTMDVLNSTDTVTIGSSITGSSSGPLTKQGSGTLTLTGSNSFSGGIRILAGVLSVTSDAGLGASGGPIQLGSATLRFAGSSPTTVARTITISGVTVNTFLDIQSDVTLTGPIRSTGRVYNSLGLTKSGTGTLRLTDNNNSFGDTFTISAGTLQVDGTIGSMNTTNSGILVQSGATLRGSGLIERDVSINLGTLALGSSTTPGILTVRGQAGFVSSPSSKFVVRIAGDTPGTEYDRLVVDGGSALFGSATLNVNFSGTLSGTQAYTILQTTNNGSIPNGLFFTGLPQGATVGTYLGTTYHINYVYGTNGRIEVTPVPEPLLPIVAGTLFLIGIYRRKRTGFPRQ